MLGKQVPQNQWPEVFGELIKHNLELEMRIKAVPKTGKEIAELLKHAEASRQGGQLDQADLWRREG